MESNSPSHLFCPSCGKKNRVESRYCIHCGNPIPTRQQNLAPRPAPKPQPPASSSDNVAKALTAICAAIAAILMFMPWIEIPILDTVGFLVSEDIQSKYTVPGAVFAINDIVSFMNNYSSSAEINKIVPGTIFAGIIWLVALGCLVVGVIRSLKKEKPTECFVTSAILCAALALILIGVANLVNSSLSSQSFNVSAIKTNLMPWAAAVFATLAAAMPAIFKKI